MSATLPGTDRPGPAPGADRPELPGARPALRRGATRSGRWLPPAALLLAIVGGWEVWVRIRNTPDYILPAPSQIAAATGDAAPLLPGHLATTALETVLGLIVGAAVGAGVALLISAVPLARRTLQPLLVASQTIPMIILAPLFALWFGLGLTPKVLIVALITFFPVTVSTAAGLTSADDELVDLIRALGGSPRTVLRLVRIPAAVPSFFAGLRISAAYAVAGAVIGESVGGSSSGLGRFINRSRQAFLVDRVMVAVVIVALLSAALYALVGVLGRWATPWLRPSRATAPAVATPALPVITEVPR